MKKLTTLTFLLLMAGVLAYAQNLTKLGVSSIRLRNFGEIQQEEQVKGYYYFYKIEGKDLKNNTYLLSILDENLREINSVEIVKPRGYYLIDGAFNEEAFGFLFYDSRNRKTEFIVYDKKLQQTGSDIQEIPNRGFSYFIYSGYARGVESEYTLLSSVPHKGFVLYTYPDKNEYEVDFYDNSAKKMWSDRAKEDKMDVELADEAFQTEKYIGSLIERRKGMMSNDSDYSLIIHEVETGKQVFNIPVEDKRFNLMTSSIFYEQASNTITLFGEFFELDDKQYKSQGIGFFYKIFDMEGHLIRDKFITWNTDIAKVTPVDAKGRIDGKKRVLFHEIVKTADGEIFAIGEQYKKAASGAGIAMTILSRGQANISTSQMEMYDMVVFHFGADLSVKSVHFFEKDRTVMTLPRGYGYTTSKKLAYIAKAYGMFDYKFSQTTKDKNTFIATYIDYDREKGEKAKNVFGAIAYTPEKTFTVDKIVLNRKSSDYFVRKAKDGYVMVTEYFRKDKKLDIRLEKINF